MVGDSRPRTETRMAGAVFTVPRVMKAPGGIETVATVTWMADTYQEDRRLATVSSGTTGNAPTIPWKGPRWRFGLIIKVNYVITSRCSLTQTPEIAYCPYTIYTPQDSRLWLIIILITVFSAHGCLSMYLINRLLALRVQFWEIFPLWNVGIEYRTVILCSSTTAFVGSL